MYVWARPGGWSTQTKTDIVVVWAGYEWNSSLMLLIYFKKKFLEVMSSQITLLPILWLLFSIVDTEYVPRAPVT